VAQRFETYQMECGLGGLLVEGNAGVGGVVRLLWNTGLRTWQLAKVLYVQACVIRVHIQACTDFALKSLQAGLSFLIESLLILS
jgi:hypothetical protein